MALSVQCLLLSASSSQIKSQEIFKSLDAYVNVSLVTSAFIFLKQKEIHHL